jgi:molybdenum cofactor cytidylyltransferase
MIGAVVLAAGQSKRMGRPKMNLPWGDATVIEQVITVLKNAGVNEIVVVTGSHSSELEAVLNKMNINIVHNTDFARGEMISSFKVGLHALDDRLAAALVVLGDQPQIEVEVVQSIIAAYVSKAADLIVPSYNRRRGHPWLLSRSLWSTILSLAPEETLRDFLNQNNDRIRYIEVNSPSILMDLDTPDDYRRFYPLNNK